MHYTVKVKHKRFLNKSQAESLSGFGIKVVLNNHVYGEYSSHIPTTLELSEEQIEQIKENFNLTIEDNLILITIS
jgi:hypothetical protein